MCRRGKWQVPRASRTDLLSGFWEEGGNAASIQVRSESDRPAIFSSWTFFLGGIFFFVGDDLSCMDGVGWRLWCWVSEATLRDAALRWSNVCACRALFLCMAAKAAYLAGQPAMLIRSMEEIYMWRVCCGWDFIFFLILL